MPFGVAVAATTARTVSALLYLQTGSRSGEWAVPGGVIRSAAFGTMPYRLVRPEQQLTTGIHDGDTDSYDHDFAEQIDEEFSDRGLLRLQWCDLPQFRIKLLRWRIEVLRLTLTDHSPKASRFSSQYTAKRRKHRNSMSSFPVILGRRIPDQGGRHAICPDMVCSVYKGAYLLSSINSRRAGIPPLEAPSEMAGATCGSTSSRISSNSWANWNYGRRNV